MSQRRRWMRMVVAFKSKSLTAQACRRVCNAHPHHTVEPRYSATACSSTVMGKKWGWSNIGVWLHFNAARQSRTSTSKRMFEMGLFRADWVFSSAIPSRKFVLTTEELHLPGRWLSGSPINRIGLALQVNLWEFYKTNLPWNYRLSDQVQYSVMGSTTSNQPWSKGLDGRTYCTY